MDARWAWWFGMGELALAVTLRVLGEDDTAGVAFSLALWALAWAAGRTRGRRH